MKIRKKSIHEISAKSIETNKGFCNFIKPFMKNKGTISSNNITLIYGKFITDEYEISKTLNKHFISIFENVAETNKIGKIGTTLGSLKETRNSFKK